MTTPFVPKRKELHAVDLSFEKDVQVELPVGLPLKGIHWRSHGSRLSPQLVFLRESHKPKTKLCTLRLIRGAAEIPDTPEYFLRFLLFSRDHTNPNRPNFCTLWLVEPRNLGMPYSETRFAKEET